MQPAENKTYNSPKEQEEERAKIAAGTSYTERFHILMRLIRVSAMINNAKIISSPVLPAKNH